MKIVLASNNKNKLKEFTELFAPYDVELIFQRDAGCNFEVDETGTTFAENAYLKAKAVADFAGLPAIADDSGLSVDALNGEPGIYSARYGLGHEATDRERLAYLLGRMHDKENRRAHFTCSICFVTPKGEKLTAEGIMEGEILKAPAGTNGFGYDPIFRPDDADCSSAELSAEGKNAISHRGKATRAFMELFKEYYNDNN